MSTDAIARSPSRGWVWSPEKRLAYSRRMVEIWAQRPRKPIPGHPDKGLGYLQRGSYRSFEESVARARDPRRKVKQETWVRYRP
jgi:hypothetical protein